MDKIWKDIEGYNGTYKISNYGEIQSLLPGKYRGGQKYGNILKPILQSTGYLAISLRKDNKTKNYLIHRLVAIAFIPNPENKKYINHINATKSDNSVHNLEWCTRKENIQHSIRLGLRKTPWNINKGIKPWNTGKLLSQEHKDKISESKKGHVSGHSRKVIDMENGKVYDSVRKAYKFSGYGISKFTKMLKNKHVNKTTFKYL